VLSHDVANMPGAMIPLDRQLDGRRSAAWSIPCRPRPHLTRAGGGDVQGHQQGLPGQRGVRVGAAADGAYTKVISEVENIGPGLSRDLTAKLSPGTYEVACKPGQTGSGIRSQITVAGATPSSPTAEQEAPYDRELELSSDGRAIHGDLTGARRGEKIEFKLANRSGRALILELKDPTGAVAGVTEPILPKSTGEFIAELKTGGNWTVVVESDGHDDITADFPVS